MASCLKLIFSFFPSLTTFSLSHFKEPKYQVEIGLFQLLKEKLLSLEALIDFWLLKFCRSFSRGKVTDTIIFAQIFTKTILISRRL